MAAKTFKLASIALSLAACAVPAMAYDSGDIIARIGAHHINPKSDNGAGVEVDDALGLTGSVVYFFTPTFAVDLLLAAPFEHDIALEGGPTVGSTQHLPPTVSLTWYPALGRIWRPFVGVGLNYTTFFSEDTTGPLAGADLKLDDSFGVAFVAGLQVDVSERWGVTLDARYMDIESDATVDGAELGTVEIDPIALGASVSYRF